MSRGTGTRRLAPVGGAPRAAPVLRARLQPPPQPAPLLPRDRLVDHLLEAVGRPLVTLLAGAGYGKTVLLAQARGRATMPWAWCTCDPRLRRANPFLEHVAAALASALPGFPADLPPSGDPDERVEALANALADAVTEDAVLSLDDVQALRDSEAADALALLMSAVPERLRVVLSARGALPLPLGRLRLRGGAELAEGVLALTEDESIELAERAGVDLPAAAIAELHERAEGWPAGLVLSARAAGSGAPVGPETDRPVLAYVAEEVLGDLPPDLIEFMTRTSVLEPLTCDVAAAVAERPEAGSLLAGLAARGVVTEEAGAYRYRAPVRRALLQRLGQRGDEPARRHRLAAAACRARGDAAAAVAHHIGARDRDGAADALASAGPGLIDSRPAAVLEGWLAEVASGDGPERPGLALPRGMLSLRQERYRAAVPELERAVAAPSAAGSSAHAAAALAGLLVALRRSGRVEDGLATARRHLPRLPVGEPAESLVHVEIAALHCARADYAQAEASLATAAELAAAAPDPGEAAPAAAVVRALGLDHPLGRTATALGALSSVVEGPAGGPARVARATVLVDAGRHAEAVEELDRMRAAAGSPPSPDPGSATAASLRLSALSGLERWRDLAVEIDGAASTIERTGGFDRSWALQAAAARLAVEAGTPAEVAARLDAARTSLDATAAPFDRSLALCDLARTAWLARLRSPAQALAREAAREARRARAPWAESRAAMIGALVWRGSPTGARLIARARRVAARAGLAGDLLRCEPVLAPLLAPPTDVASPDRVAAPERQDGLAGDQTAHPGALRLVTLGDFAVMRDGVVLPPGAFRRRKARVLLAMLACARAPVHREVLVEELWPELPVERGLRALYSTLYALRRALEPGSPRAARSRIVGEGETYRLSLGEDDRWDAAEFLRLAGVARAARGGGSELEALHAAGSAWAGPLLPEFVYADWAAELRSQLDQAHIGVLLRLVEVLSDAGRHGEAIACLRRLTSLEPEREEWHRELMRLYERTGESALALRQYQECRRQLRERLGIEPGASTRELYAQMASATAPAPAVSGG